jgi:hypothetical protein
VTSGRAPQHFTFDAKACRLFTGHLFTGHQDQNQVAARMLHQLLTVKPA